MKPLKAGIIIGMELVRYGKIADESEYETASNELESLLAQNKITESAQYIAKNIVSKLKQNKNLVDDQDYKQGWIAYEKGESLILRDDEVNKNWAIGFLSRQYSQYLN